MFLPAVKKPSTCFCKYMHKNEHAHSLEVANNIFKEESSVSLKYGPEIKF